MTSPAIGFVDEEIPQFAGSFLGQNAGMPGQMVNDPDVSPEELKASKRSIVGTY